MRSAAALRTAIVDADVAGFGGHRVRAAKNRTIDHQAGPDSGADGGIKHDGVAAARAVARLDRAAEALHLIMDRFGQEPFDGPPRMAKESFKFILRVAEGCQGGGEGITGLIRQGQQDDRGIRPAVRPAGIGRGDALLPRGG